MSGKTESEIFEWAFVANESQVDSLGHLNNAAYLTLFELARWEFITARGYGLAEVHAHRKSPVVLDCQLTFKAEIRNREKIVVRSQTLSYEGKIFKLAQKMIKEDGREACLATFTGGFFDLETRRLILPTPHWLKAVGLTP